MRTKHTPAVRGHITADAARRIAIRAQGLAQTADRPKTPADVLRRVAAVQLDTISILARSHELVTYARAGAVGRPAVEDAYWGRGQAFEYHAHANCILPIESWPYFAFRRRSFRAHRWAHPPANAYREVQARLREGPVTVTDLGGGRNGTAGWWNWSEAKMAVEAMYYRGEAICTSRRNWKRVYDLPERVLPPELLAHEPDDAECYRYLVAATAAARGVATRRDLAAYFLLLLTRLAPSLERNRLLDDAIADSGLVPVEVEGWPAPAYADPAALGSRGPLRHRPVLLSPFDSLVWANPPAAGLSSREYTERLLGYTYTLEVYLPKHKREHGYYTMPLLARGRIAGHVDPAREGRTLVARNVALDDETYVDDLAAALKEAASWVGCTDIRIDSVRPKSLAPALTRALG